MLGCNGIGLDIVDFTSAFLQERAQAEVVGRQDVARDAANRMRMKERQHSAVRQVAVPVVSVTLLILLKRGAQSSLLFGIVIIVLDLFVFAALVLCFWVLFSSVLFCFSLL